MHGGAAALARASFAAAEEAPPQALLASSMLDLPAYRALAPPSVRQAPAMYYMHENQLTYPLPPGVERDLGLGMKQLLSAAAADVVYFNSDFHRREFLTAAGDLLEAMPDERCVWLVEEVSRKAHVLAVGCDLRRFDDHRPPPGARGRWGDVAQGPLVVWNQRWEYDKAPGDLFRALYVLQEEGCPFRIALAGANQGLPTAEFVEARARLGEHVVQWGRLDDFADYAALLWEADVVVSTALHEFFGVAVVEALYCGCRPVLPRRLSYPEIVPAEMHARVLYVKGELVASLGRALREPMDWSEDWQRTWVTPYDWGYLARRYDEEIWQCWDGSSARTRST